MDVTLLIDAIVRQTTVLIAQLATSAGARATLAHTANQVFVDLVHELKEQGLSNKLIAEMFGLSLRTYHNKIVRLSESSTERGQSLWAALLAFIQERRAVLRAELFAHFARDPETTVRAVLKDLVDSGLVFRTGRGDATAYRAASAEEVSLAGPQDEAERLDQLVWVAIYKYAPVSEEELAEHVPAEKALLQGALERLERDRRVRRSSAGGQARFEADECVIPLGAPVGWEAAVFDHYQAMVTALCTKLRLGRRQAAAGEWVGGSTYGFDLWDGHPHQEEVLGLLQEMRDRAASLRRKVESFNAAQRRTAPKPLRVIAYVGQTVVGLEDREEESS